MPEDDSVEDLLMADVTADPYVRAEAALTNDEQHRFLERWTKWNPKWQGAHISDVLQVLEDADTHCAMKDLMCRELGTLTQTESIAVDVLMILGEAVTGKTVVELANRLAVVSDDDDAACPACAGFITRHTCPEEDGDGT